MVVLIIFMATPCINSNKYLLCN